MEWKKREAILQPNKKRYSITENIARIRGIPNDKVLNFLNPTINELHNPKLLKNIEKASEIIIDAIKQGKKICISGDADCDGIMSLAIMFRYLKLFTKNIYYIYNQRSEGHGVENQLQYVQEDTDLIIILDSSTNSIKACKQLKDMNIEIIILDHHQVEVENPYVTLVNPQNDDYPNKNLSGAGVTFKTIQVMDETLQSGKVWNLVDLCGVGLYGDMMSVKEMENRYLIIKAMKTIRNFGLLTILNVKNISLEDVNSQTLGFNIVPLINSATRLGKIELAIELMLSDDYDECIYLAEELSKLNDERKRLQKDLAEEYIHTVNFDDKVLIAIGDIPSKSFNGLIATTITQKYQKPTLVLREHKGSLSGSYRTYGDFDMYKFLKECPHINSVGGHPFAGGVILYTKNYEKFREYINNKLEGLTFESVVEYDMEIESSEITENLILDVEKMNYLTGQGFPTVTFKITGMIYDSDSRKTMGESNNHVKMSLEDITLVKFNTSSDYGLDIPDMANIEAIGQLNLNIYRTKWGKEFKTNQLLINDIKVV